MCVSGREELCEPFFAHNRLNGTLYDGETRLFDSTGSPLAMYSMGGLSEFAVMPAFAAARIPDELPLLEPAILGCAMLTAYGATKHVAKLAPGESVAVEGVGGVGSNLVQMARALGAEEVIAVDLSAERLEASRALGADETINVSNGDPVAQLREHTNGRGVDVVFEAVGNPRTFQQATEMVADGGRAVMVGIASTGRKAEVEITRLVRRKLQILGSFGGRPRNDLAELMDMVCQGRLNLDAAVGERFSLEDAGIAYSRLREGDLVGRALVEMAR